MEKSLKDACIAAASLADRRRFWSKVQKTDTCWLWKGCTRKGYGDFWVQGANVRAHRATKIWSCRKKQKSLANLICCHSCNNASCVRPSHIYWGTHAQNTIDRTAFGVHLATIKRGTESVNAILNEKQAQQIVDEYSAGGMSGYMLAKKYKVSRGAIDNILRGKTWRAHVNLPAKNLQSPMKGYRRGATVHGAKLSENDILEIRKLRAAGWKLQPLAKKFAVRQTNICAICNRVTWRHLP